MIPDPTQNQALAEILFLYKEVLDTDPGWMGDVVRAKRLQRLPVVLTRDEVPALLAELDGVSWIMAMLLYGAGLRLMECLRLRVKDNDFGRNETLVREGKGNNDRLTMLPAAVKEPLVASVGAPLDDLVGMVHTRRACPAGLLEQPNLARVPGATQWCFLASRTSLRESCSLRSILPAFHSSMKPGYCAGPWQVGQWRFRHELKSGTSRPHSSQW